jgi:hypothetical protein
LADFGPAAEGTVLRPAGKTSRAVHSTAEPPGGANPCAKGRSSGINVLYKIADRIEEHLERPAVAETWENGKPVRETPAADLPLAVDHFRYVEPTIFHGSNDTLYALGAGLRRSPAASPNLRSRPASPHQST